MVGEQIEINESPGRPLIVILKLLDQWQQPKGRQSMRRLPVIVAIAGMAGFVGHKLSTQTKPRETGFAAMRDRMMKRMMASMPEDSPPKLVMSILPHLQAQNEEILALLKKQNDLLRRLTAGQEHK